MGYRFDCLVGRCQHLAGAFQSQACHQNQRALCERTVPVSIEIRGRKAASVRQVGKADSVPVVFPDIARSIIDTALGIVAGALGLAQDAFHYYCFRNIVDSIDYTANARDLA
jgi:hypothetical protein